MTNDAIVALGSEGGLSNVCLERRRHDENIVAIVAWGLGSASTLTFADGGKDFQWEAFFVHRRGCGGEGEVGARTLRHVTR